MTEPVDVLAAQRPAWVEVPSASAEEMEAAVGRLPRRRPWILCDDPACPHCGPILRERGA